MSRELERLQKQGQSALDKFKQVQATNSEVGTMVDQNLKQVQAEYCRVAELSHNAPAFIEDLDRQFKEKTHLTDGDIAFVMLATALQCARQYILTNDRFRLSADQGDKLIEGAMDKILPPSWQEILFQSVPYDAIKTGSHISETGIAGTTHRFRTLGHDPVLGWIFGTANIMTTSLTKTDFLSTYQVKDMCIVRHYPLGTPGMLNNAIKYARKDPMLLAASVARQAIHFGSDYFTKQGLPVPIIATVNNDLVKDMITKGHIDMWSVTRGAIIGAFINQLIILIHKLLYQPSQDGSETLYEIRTRKIISYSNAIATGSNIIVTAFTRTLNTLDVGGALVTIHRLISDYAFIQSVKRDFLKNEIYKTVVGSPYDFMEVK